MKKPAILFIFLLYAFPIIQVNAQKFITKNGKISFYSDAPTEKIEAHNNQVNSALDITSGDFVFKVLMKSFQFEKALMQEHFNENYVESDKFPNATFKGKITNHDQIDWAREGKYAAEVEGELTIHGITQKISETGNFEVKSNVINGYAVFYVLVADYNIKIPQAVITNIAEKIEIKVEISLTSLNK